MASLTTPSSDDSWTLQKRNFLSSQNLTQPLRFFQWTPPISGHSLSNLHKPVLSLTSGFSANCQLQCRQMQLGSCGVSLACNTLSSCSTSSTGTHDPRQSCQSLDRACRGNWNSSPHTVSCNISCSCWNSFRLWFLLSDLEFTCQIRMLP